MKLIKIILITCSIFLATTVSAVWSDSQQTQYGESSDKQAQIKIITPQELSQLFYKAQGDFLANHTAAAAETIRKAANLLEQEAKLSADDPAKLLSASAKELKDAALQVETQSEVSDLNLRRAFRRAHHALALYYHDKATKSILKNEISKAGEYLMAAASHLEDAWHWSGRRVGEASQSAINSAKDISHKILTGLDWAIDEVNTKTKDLGREINKMGKIEIMDQHAYSFHADISTAIVEVAKKTIPAVAHIQVTERQEIPNPFWPYQKDPSFRQYFNLPKKMPKQFERELVGVGTGIIINSEGYILTNNHVVDGATKIQVTLSDGTQYSATVIGVDPKTDLGVIKISAEKPLPYVTFGNSDEIQVGQWVVAIGHPRGLDQTVTQGIISAKHRHGAIDPSSYSDFIQTDAPINPGNSGGPLLDLYGEVIGVNSAILSESGGFEGIGFSIPSNMAVHIANELIDHGKVIRGWLGLNAQDLTPDLAKSFGMKILKGALVADVLKNGPAYSSGIHNGDVILSFDNIEISDSTSLRNKVANTPVGKMVNITVMRNGKEQKLSVKIGNMEALNKSLAETLKNRLRIGIEPVSKKDTENFGMTLSNGVKINWIDPNGPLGKLGFEKGDILLALNGRPIQDVQSFIETIAAFPHHQKIELIALDHKTGQTGYAKVEIS